MTEPLPDLQEAALDADTLAALVRDLETQTRILDVIVKGGAVQRADTSPTTLSGSVAQLLNGQVRGVQVRYEHAGSEWRDTLMRRDGGVRLVRIQMPW